MRALTWAAVCTRRLARHALLAPAPAADLAAVVGAVCGIHAQVLPAAELSLCIRLVGVTRRDIAAALWERREIVKTYGIRGTLHLFPAADLPLWMAALRAGAPPLDVKILTRLGMDAAQHAAILAAIGDALDGRRLTARQLGEAVVGRLGAWAGAPTPAWDGTWPRWRMLLGAAATAGLLCFGPNEGREVAFVRPDQWIGTWRDEDPAAALAKVFRRYLRAYGPATPRDFAQWFALPQRVARDLAAALGDELEEVDVEGSRCLQLAADAESAPAPVEDAVQLLPHFDCYGIGCHPRARVFPGAPAMRALAHGQAGPVPLLLIDGVVAGVWERQASGRRIAVRVDPFVPLTAPQQTALEGAASRLGAILEAPATLTIGPVTVRPHL